MTASASAISSDTAVPACTETIMRAYRFALDPTAAQQSLLAQHAGTARWAFNHALAVKQSVYELWRAEVAALVSDGLTEEVARKQVSARKDATLRVPNAFEVKSKHWISVRGDDRKDEEGLSPWWHTVSSYVFSSAFQDADAAWKNWLDSLSGKRKSRMGFPRRKKKFASRDSFRIHHDVKKPTIRPDGYRRLLVPRLGSLRIHDTAKPLVRMIARGGVVQSVTISRGGHRWYASVLVKAPTELVVRSTTRRQRDAGSVGVDVGVLALASLSTGEQIANPRHLRRTQRRIKHAQRALSRTQRGSAGRRSRREKLARLHHQVAEQRHASLHQITKKLASTYALVAIEDLSVSGMTSSAKGTREKPGRRVRQKAGLNRSILDAGFGEFRRQLTYKTSWYGSTLALCDRWYPSSKTCSDCGHVKAKLTLSERTFHCDQCGMMKNRDVNAAINILRASHPDQPVAPDGGETRNGRGEDVSRMDHLVHAQSSVKRQGPSHGGSPRSSDRPAIPQLRRL